MLIEATQAGSRNRGRRDFRVPPRKGDYLIATDEDGNGKGYEVVAVVHPLAPDVTSCGDVIIKYRATETALRRSFSDQ